MPRELLPFSENDTLQEREWRVWLTLKDMLGPDIAEQYLKKPLYRYIKLSADAQAELKQAAVELRDDDFARTHEAAAAIDRILKYGDDDAS